MDNSETKKIMFEQKQLNDERTINKIFLCSKSKRSLAVHWSEHSLLRSNENKVEFFSLLTGTVPLFKRMIYIARVGVG